MLTHAVGLVTLSLNHVLNKVVGLLSNTIVMYMVFVVSVSKC